MLYSSVENSKYQKLADFSSTLFAKYPCETVLSTYKNRDVGKQRSSRDRTGRAQQVPQSLAIIGGSSEGEDMSMMMMEQQVLILVLTIQVQAIHYNLVSSCNKCSYSC